MNNILWHRITSEEALLELKSSMSGLSTEEIPKPALFSPDRSLKPGNKGSSRRNVTVQELRWP